MGVISAVLRETPSRRRQSLRRGVGGRYADPDTCPRKAVQGSALRLSETLWTRLHRENHSAAVLDSAGRVRKLSHPRKPYSSSVETLAAEVSAKQPRELAEEYVREVLPQYQLGADMATNLSAAVSGEMDDQEGPQLRLSGEKVLRDQATVSYSQTYMGLPIWEAGLAVQMRGRPFQVMGSQSSVHYEVSVEPPEQDAPYLPDKIAGHRIRQQGRQRQQVERPHRAFRAEDSQGRRDARQVPVWRRVLRREPGRLRKTRPVQAKHHSGDPFADQDAHLWRRLIPDCERNRSRWWRRRWGHSGVTQYTSNIDGLS